MSVAGAEGEWRMIKNAEEAAEYLATNAETKEGTYIRFEKTILQNPKTQIWNVVAKQDNFVLGQIKWFGRWRKYSFFPNQDAVFENTCLVEVAEFIEALMAERKNKHRRQKLTLDEIIELYPPAPMFW